MVELNCLFQKDQGKTASAARILSPNPTQRPLPCLLIKSFFYRSDASVYVWLLGQIYILYYTIFMHTKAVASPPDMTGLGFCVDSDYF